MLGMHDAATRSCAHKFVPHNVHTHACKHTDAQLRDHSTGSRAVARDA